MIALLCKYLCGVINALLLLAFAGTPVFAAETILDFKSPAVAVDEKGLIPRTKKSLTLTDKEKAWLADHKIIRVAFNGYFPPCSFLNDDGKFEGLAVDVMHALADRIGISIELSPIVVLKDLYEAAQKREVDVVATMGHQPEREEWFVFTQPYIFKSLVIMTRKDMTTISKSEDLAGKQVALVKSYQYVKPLLEKYPTVKPIYVDTMLDGLNAVAVGKADAAITFLGAGYYLKTKYHIDNLKFAAVFERDRFTESIAVRKDWPELASILDKALDSITEGEMAELGRRWVGPGDVPSIALRTVIKYIAVIFGFALLLVSGFLIWNRSLKKEVGLKTAELRKELAERKKAEDRLQEREIFSRNIFDSLQVNLAVVDTSGVILKVNRAWEEFLRENSEGKTVSAGTGDNYFEICRKAEGRYSDEASEVLRGFEAILAGKVDYFDLEYPCHSPQKKRWFLMRAVPLQTQTGGLVVSHINISGKKEVEEALQEKEHFLTESQRIAHVGSWIYDLKGHIVWSDETYNIFGVSRESFIPDPESFLNLIHPDDRSAMQRWIEACVAGEKPGELKFRIVWPDGSIHFISGCGELRYDADNRPAYMAGTAQDITEHHRVANEIRIVNEELLALNRIITAIAGVSDLREILEKVMEQALAITDLEGGTICIVTPDETLELAAHRGTSEATITDLTTNEVKVGDCLCGECARDHKPLILWDREAVLNFSTREATRGEDIRFHAAFPLVSGEKCLGVLCVFTRTDFKPLERRLKLIETVTSQIALVVENAQLLEESRVYSATLEDTVRDRTKELWDNQKALINIVEDVNEARRELEAANERLQELDRLKSMFIASMSHELRTPLNSIIGFTGLILQGMTGEINEEQRDQIRRVSKAGKHLLSLITDIIDISKIEAGKIDAYPEEFQCGELLQEAISNLKLQIRDKGLQIEVHMEPDEITLKTDRKRLLQCVLNYLSNAVKFTEKGKIILFAKENNDIIEIGVTDTGIGIKEEDVPMLFHSFVRLDSPLKMITPGTGLGLYLTKKLVREVLGGEVSVKSTFGKGSTFTMRIPGKMSQRDASRKM